MPISKTVVVLRYQELSFLMRSSCKDKYNLDLFLTSDLRGRRHDFVFYFKNIFSFIFIFNFIVIRCKHGEMGKFNEIIQSETPTLVDFFATWCGPCKAMQPVLDQIKIDLGESIRILKIDVDKNQEVAEQFKVRGVPTFIFFKNGEIIWRKSGAMSIQTLKQKIFGIS
jgi:thioredoxin 1